MLLVELYRRSFEHEKDANEKMLGMLESVAADKRNDERFQRALVLAAHLAACRENWLDFIQTGGENQSSWWPDPPTIAELRDRFRRFESEWTAFLANLDEQSLTRDFEFTESDGSRWRWNVEGQLLQLLGHAPYHRGQVALLVDQLGGETVDTDYVDWAFPQQPDRWGKVK